MNTVTRVYRIHPSSASRSLLQRMIDVVGERTGPHLFLRDVFYYLYVSIFFVRHEIEYQRVRRIA